jgi:translation initiation factor eIF-2B subunit alpha/methylthioribose-1-phosphate isomerase
MLDGIKNGKEPLDLANDYVEDIIDRCHRIGINGEKLIKDGVKILTHCNAGALATVDWGTALAPFYVAHRKGKKFFVFADETRPRCQGLLTDWELEQEGIEHAVIADNAAGYFMKKGEIDMVITGADRITKNGDFANKIGTYEKAVLAHENNIPFYVAAPISTFDKTIESGDKIKIEERGREELSKINNCKIMPDFTKVKNPAFDVTPKKYVKGYITEEGIIKEL